jgi:hypothetical protein
MSWDASVIIIKVLVWIMPIGILFLCPQVVIELKTILRSTRVGLRSLATI